MSDLLEGIDPEAIAILREVARDPNSSLFKYTPAQVRRGVQDPGPGVSGREAGLSLAEREIHRTHREDVAEVISRIAKIAIMASEFGRTWYTDIDEDNNLRATQSTEDVAAMIQLLLSRSSVHRHALQSANSSLDGGKSLSGLKSAIGWAHRLVPSGISVFDSALQDAAVGSIAVARRTLVVGIGSGRLAALEVYALLALGILHSADGNRSRAMGYYSLAFDANPGYLHCALSLATTSLLLGDEAKASHALSMARELTPTSEVLAAVLKQLKTSFLATNPLHEQGLGQTDYAAVLHRIENAF